jgi:thiosulfate/3-mercaptopyruvate sulfurtransferase
MGTACVADHEPQEVSGQVAEQQEVAPISPFLLSVDDVNELLLSRLEGLVVFEISTVDKYAQGHLPEAQRLWRPDYENLTDYPYEGMMASREQMCVLLREKGVDKDTEIILYDTNGSVDAMRVLWILRNYGHHKVAVMDGGKVAWQQAGYKLSEVQPIKPKASAYCFPDSITTEHTATLEEVLAGIRDTNVVIVDTREPEEFLGKPYFHKGEVLYYKKGAFSSGCIPGAIHLNWSDAVDLNGDHCFKSLKTLHYNFAKKGITPDKQIITYCQSGVRSAHTTFVLSELLGFPNVKNYDGSWIEWSYFHQEKQTVPIEQHTTPAAVAEEYKRLASTQAQ